jgi:hypothetical protein
MWRAMMIIGYLVEAIVYLGCSFIVLEMWSTRGIHGF